MKCDDLCIFAGFVTLMVLPIFWYATHDINIVDSSQGRPKGCGIHLGHEQFWSYALTLAQTNTHTFNISKNSPNPRPNVFDHFRPLPHISATGFSVGWTSMNKWLIHTSMCGVHMCIFFYHARISRFLLWIIHFLVWITPHMNN